MSGFKGVHDLSAERHQRFDIKRTTLDPLAEQFAIKQLHDDEVFRLKLLNAVNGADVRMIERRRSARLPLKALQKILIGGHRRRQKLQRDVPPEVRVFRLIDDAHSTFAELRSDAIVRDGAA